MTEPCSKEEVIDKLQGHITDLLVNQAKIGGDVAHIKSRIDNGMGHTIHEIAQRINDLVSSVTASQSESEKDRAVIHERLKEAQWWVTAIRNTVYMISAFAVTGGLVALYFFVRREIAP